jgi:hypothetical protein
MTNLAGRAIARDSTPALALKYLLAIAIFLATADFFYARASYPGSEPRLDNYPSLLNRTAWYRQHAADYNLVFIGDSRTFCGIHPFLLDPLLGTSSINLAVLAHWFPTQLPEIADLASHIPKGTTVVWSVGVVNFVTPGSIQRTYPVGFYNAARYLWWGAQTKGLLDNLLFYNPALYFLSERESTKQQFENFLRKPAPLPQRAAPAATVGAAPSQNPDPHAAEASELLVEYQKNPEVSTADLETVDGRLTAAIIQFRRGGYYRIELDHDYFVRKKSEVTFRWGPVSTDPASFRMFEDALQIFKAHDIKLVVNEIEEAPFMYSDKQWHRDFMRDVVEKRVRELGFSYIRAGFDRLSDDDYFDYNHLNSRGVARFMPMLAEQLRPYVSPYPRQTP